MQRYFFFVLAIAFFVYVAQARPGNDASSMSTKIEEEVSRIISVMQDQASSLTQDAKIQDVVKHAQEFFQNAAAELKKKAEELMPKTDGAA